MSWISTPSGRDIHQPIGQRPTTVPPRPPPGGRPSSERPAPMAASSPTAAMRPTALGAAMQADGLAATAGAGYNPNSYPPPMGTPPGPQVAMMAHGTPGQMEQHPAAQGMAPHEGHQQPQRTVLGVQAPQGVGNYGGGGYRPSGQMPAQQAAMQKMGLKMAQGMFGGKGSGAGAGTPTPPK